MENPSVFERLFKSKPASRRAANAKPVDDVGDARRASLAAQQLEAVTDGFGFDGIGRRVGEVKLVIADGVVGGVLAPGNFGEAEGDLERVGVGGQQFGVVGARVVQAVAGDRRGRG